MARKSARKPSGPAKAIRSLNYIVPAGVSYLDIFKDLSMVNRKLMRQGHVLGVESVEFYYTDAPAASARESVLLKAYTAGDSWSVHNAHVKGQALWNEMNQLVLDDNPSVQGTWADYKVYLDNNMRTGTILTPVIDNVAYLGGEWNYSDYVLPQHEVDPATGLPLAADQCQAHLIGPNVGAAGNFISVGLVEAYQQSRATVQTDDPNVPVTMSNSFFSLLTDSGSQEPELADVLILENDQPPYDLDNYPGGALNAPYPIETDFAIATKGSPTGMMQPFVAQCGLIKFDNVAFDIEGNEIASTNLYVRVNVMAGSYKGIAAIRMGQ
jgi:hypothetical protein